MKIESINPKVYFDISISSKPIGRIVFELFSDKAPKTCENFLHLCKGDKANKDGEPLSFKGNHFHRVIKNFMIQAGDITFANDHIDEEHVGRGGESIFGDKFEDENLEESTFATIHNLAMANSGPNTNGSQFFINTYPSPHLNGKHTVFGRVVHGKSVVRSVEKLDVNDKSNPFEPVKITDCGEWSEEMGVPLYNACDEPTTAGDVYEEYPDDDTHFDKDNTVEAYEAVVKIKDSGAVFFKSKDTRKAWLKYLKTLRYINEFIPDFDSQPEYEPKFQDLKIKTYSNLSLVAYQLGDYKKSLLYSNYLLESDKLTAKDKAKGHYRRGLALQGMKNYDEALTNFKECQKLNPEDKAVPGKIETVEKLIEEAKEKEKKKYAKFFG
ncbi:hypothetical protein WICPIJ_005218 [Wickerhamomyces pijperi]|uniref:peptidylprolyl isomerase n=1 Tax=Wickerhamomyces pijperi TaxID=599730 RepID=A0A9P8Q6L4_WICPI|nr:hypothetical protein WICPIJ_005218 [Wickerhamomyces pijperi]